MKVAIIPARGGSTRIPRKNIRPFFGKPIMAYSIEVAQRSRLFDAVYVSTEDDEIGQVARKYGAALIHRPPELAEIGAPDCGTQEVTRHAVTVLQGLGDNVEYACCIYPCAPMLTAHDLELGWMAIQKPDINYAFQVLVNPLRDAGQFYWSKAWALLARHPMNMNDWDTMKIISRPERAIDINTEIDWIRAEQLYATHHPETTA